MSNSASPIELMQAAAKKYAGIKDFDPLTALTAMALDAGEDGKTRLAALKELAKYAHKTKGSENNALTDPNSKGDGVQITLNLSTMPVDSDGKAIDAEYKRIE